MSKRIALVCAFAAAGFVAACAQPEEEVVFVEQPAPIQPERSYTKY